MVLFHIRKTEKSRETKQEVASQHGIASRNTALVPVTINYAEIYRFVFSEEMCAKVKLVKVYMYS